MCTASQAGDTGTKHDDVWFFTKTAQTDRYNKLENCFSYKLLQKRKYIHSVLRTVQSFNFLTWFYVELKVVAPVRQGQRVTDWFQMATLSTPWSHCQGFQPDYELSSFIHLWYFWTCPKFLWAFMMEQGCLRCAARFPKLLCSVENRPGNLDSGTRALVPRRYRALQLNSQTIPGECIKFYILTYRSPSPLICEIEKKYQRTSQKPIKLLALEVQSITDKGIVKLIALTDSERYWQLPFVHSQSHHVLITKTRQVLGYYWGNLFIPTYHIFYINAQISLVMNDILSRIFLEGMDYLTNDSCNTICIIVIYALIGAGCGAVNTFFVSWNNLVYWDHYQCHLYQSG